MEGITRRDMAAGTLVALAGLGLPTLAHADESGSARADAGNVVEVGDITMELPEGWSVKEAEEGTTSILDADGVQRYTLRRVAKPSGEAGPGDSMALEVTEYMWAFSNEGWLYWTAVGYNPNDDLKCSFPTFHVTAYDENGGILASQDQVMMECWPLAKIAFSGQVDTGGIAPARVEVTMNAPSGNDWQPADPADAPVYEITNLTEVDTFGISSSFNGTVTNKSSQGGTICITALMRDEAGTLVDGVSGFAYDVPAGGSASFSLNCYSGAIYHTSFEAIATFWGSY